MTKEEYENYIQALKEHGYKFVGSRYNDRQYYYKAIEYRDDGEGDSRAVCQLVFNLYETEDNRNGNVYHSIEPVVMVSRNIEERLDLTISHPKRSIEDCERIAKEFLRWVDININIECNEFFNQNNQNNQDNGK